MVPVENEDNVDDANTPSNTFVVGALGGSDFDFLMKGFNKMESEVLKLRDSLTAIVDDSVKQMKDNFDMVKIEERFVKMEEIVLHNKSELSNLNNKIDQVILDQQKIKSVDSDALDQFIASSRTTFTRLENITTVHMDAGGVASVLESVKKGQVDEKAMKEFIDESKNIHVKLDEVSKATSEIKDDLAKRDEKSVAIQLKSVLENAEKVMPVLNAISNNVSSLAEQLKVASPIDQPSVRPKETNATENVEQVDKTKDSEIPTPPPTTTDKPEVEIIEPKKRKGIFFSSSIGLQCNIQELANQLNSRICTIKTFHIEKHTNSRDPELFLRKNLEVLNQEDDIDFIIISVGTNDITKLDLSEELEVINDVACGHSKNLAHIANELSQKYNIEVFIVERPARFDTEDRDPEGIRSVLTISSNGMYPSLITPLKRVHYIPLPSLSTGRRNRDCFGKDGVHLTPKGQRLFCLELEAGVKNVFHDLIEDNFQKVGKTYVPRKENQNYQRVENTRSRRNTEDAGAGNGGNNPHGGWNDRFQQDGNKYNDHQHNGKFRNDGQFRNNGHFRNNEQNMSNGQHRSNGQFRKNEQYRSNEQYRNNEQKRNNEQYRYNGQNRNNEKYRNDGNYRRNQNEHNRTNGQYRENEQDGQNRYRGQNDRTNTRAPQMPDSVRDYLQQCMQDNFQRY